MDNSYSSIHKKKSEKFFCYKGTYDKQQRQMTAEY